MKALSEADFAAIKARHAAATPGAWQWYGNTDTKQVYLSTTDRGRQFVMSFRRWGMRAARPEFWPVTDITPPLHVIDVARYEVLGRQTRHAAGLPSSANRYNSNLYRADFIGLDHPDAELIAHAPSDIGLLIAEVERLRRSLP